MERSGFTVATGRKLIVEGGRRPLRPPHLAGGFLLPSYGLTAVSDKGILRLWNVLMAHVNHSCVFNFNFYRIGAAMPDTDLPCTIENQISSFEKRRKPRRLRFLHFEW